MGGVQKLVLTILVAAIAGAMSAMVATAPSRDVFPHTVALRASSSHAQTTSVLRMRSLSTEEATVPPMGWNAYNRYSWRATASIVEANAQALVSSGMKAEGYDYVNLDGGWDLPSRGPDGSLVPDPIRFPQGIKPVSDYVHALGLKFGIYTSAGTLNCAGTSAGSYGHYQQDAALFASWGVDYVKFDWCYIPYRDYPRMTARQVSQLLADQMGQALASTHRAIVFDINDTRWQSDAPWTWAPTIACVWRVTNDIQDTYAGFLNSFHHDVSLGPLKKGVGWNDPDMLEIGNGGLTVAEERAQFSLWAELAAPLIAGNDLSTMSAATRAILTNRAVIAVDQDPLGRQGVVASSFHGHWILTKQLRNGERSVVFFNETSLPATMSTTTTAIGLPKSPLYECFNVWSSAENTSHGALSEAVPAHGVVMLIVGAKSVGTAV